MRQHTWTLKLPDTKIISPQTKPLTTAANGAER